MTELLLLPPETQHSHEVHSSSGAGYDYVEPTVHPAHDVSTPDAKRLGSTVVSVPELLAPGDTTAPSESHEDIPIAAPAGEKPLVVEGSRVFSRNSAPWRYKGAHRRESLAGKAVRSAKDYFGVNTEHESNQSRQDLSNIPRRVEGRAPARQPFFPQPLQEGESPLAWLINNGANPGDAHETAIPRLPTNEEKSRRKTTQRDDGSDLILEQLTESEAQSADKRLSELAAMEADVAAGGALPSRREVLLRLGLARHSKDREDTEVADAATTRLAGAAYKRLTGTVQYFVEQGIMPSKHWIAEELYPGKQPEELSQGELDYVGLALRNIADSDQVQSATVEELARHVKATGQPPTIAEVKDRLFPYTLDDRQQLDIKEQLNIDGKAFDVMADLLRMTGWDLAQKFLEKGRKPSEEEIADTLFKEYDLDKLSPAQRWTVDWASRLASAAGAKSKPQRIESVWSKMRRVARMATATGALALSLVRPTAPPSLAPVAETRFVAPKARV